MAMPSTSKPDSSSTAGQHVLSWRAHPRAPWRRGTRTARRAAARGGSRWSWPSRPTSPRAGTRPPHTRQRPGHSSSVPSAPGCLPTRGAGSAIKKTRPVSCSCACAAHATSVARRTRAHGPSGGSYTGHARRTPSVSMPHRTHHLMPRPLLRSSSVPRRLLLTLGMNNLPRCSPWLEGQARYTLPCLRTATSPASTTQRFLPEIPSGTECQEEASCWMPALAWNLSLTLRQFRS
jgi:hypothetical protein